MEEKDKTAKETCEKLDENFSQGEEKEEMVDVPYALMELNCKLGFLSGALIHYQDRGEANFENDMQGLGYIVGDLEMEAFHLMQEAQEQEDQRKQDKKEV